MQILSAIRSCRIVRHYSAAHVGRGSYQLRGAHSNAKPGEGRDDHPNTGLLYCRRFTADNKRAAYTFGPSRDDGQRGVQGIKPVRTTQFMSEILNMFRFS